MLLQRGGFQQLNQGVGRAEGLAVLRDHAAGDSQALSLDDFAALVKNKAPLKADKYKLQTTNAKNPENIMEYDVVRYLLTDLSFLLFLICHQLSFAACLPGALLGL